MIHDAPLAMKTADTAILASIEDRGLPAKVELLPARTLGDDLYEICCVPFFVQDVACGDVVLAPPGRLAGLEGPLVQDVTDPSGRVCLRVWFPGTTEPTDRLAVEADIEAHTGRIERLTEHLLAIDAAEEAARTLADVLEDWEGRGVLAYETGHTQR